MPKPTPPPPESFRKSCALCSTPRPVLIRCQIDATQKWYLVCPGKCWKDVSGGEVDGKAEFPYYRYGGMWKNKHELVSAKMKVPKNSKRDGKGEGGEGEGVKAGNEEENVEEVKHQ